MVLLWQWIEYRSIVIGDILQRLHLYLLLVYDTVYISCVIAYIYIRAFIIVVLSVHLVVISARGYLCRFLLLCEEGTFFACIMAIANLVLLHFTQSYVWYYYRHRVQLVYIFRPGLIIVCRVHIYSLYYYSIRVGYYYHLQSLQLCLILLPL